MTDVAYLLFTFMACLFGLGVGLALHQIWYKAKAKKGESVLFNSDVDDDTASWESYANWQAANNRRFAMQVVSCGAAPLVFASVAWSQRADVVHAVCDNVVQMVGQAYICM